MKKFLIFAVTFSVLFGAFPEIVSVEAFAAKENAEKLKKEKAETSDEAADEADQKSPWQEIFPSGLYQGLESKKPLENYEQLEKADFVVIYAPNYLHGGYKSKIKEREHSGNTFVRNLMINEQASHAKTRNGRKKLHKKLTEEDLAESPEGDVLAKQKIMNALPGKKIVFIADFSSSPKTNPENYHRECRRKVLASKNCQLISKNGRSITGDWMLLDSKGNVLEQGLTRKFLLEDDGKKVKARFKKYNEKH